MRSAFGTFIGLPDPDSFGGDASFVRARWLCHPEQTFGAFRGEELIGSNLLTRWGSFGFFGPLSIRPEDWDRGYASPLMEPVIEAIEGWKLAGSGLFTFPHSLKHIGLYQKFGFYPGHLNVIFEKTPEIKSASGSPQPAAPDSWQGFSREIGNAVLPGLDLSDEGERMIANGLGNVLVTPSGNGFAICHSGGGSEAGSGACYVKFAAARPGPGSPAAFEELLDTCEGYAAGRSEKLMAGVSVGRRGAYEALRKRGYRMLMTGLSMHRPGPALFASPEHFVLDDWR